MKRLDICVFLLVSGAMGLPAQDVGLPGPGVAQEAAPGALPDNGQVVNSDNVPSAEDITKIREASRTEAALDVVGKSQERQKLAQEVRAIRASQGGPRRFAEDLFSAWEEMSNATEGGISEDYVLGVGDQMLIAGFGSATFEMPGKVDGRGEVLIPKVGTVKVAGMTLGRAKTAIQRKVNQQLAGTSVDISVTKLRQVRVFVQGEVVKPGGFLVPSLCSVINVLGLAGGPSALGSYRQIRIVRGGRTIHQVDLYPLRAEGQGNFNIALQNGDTIFVPLAYNPVLLEGSFLRVMGRDTELDSGMVRAMDPKTKDQSGQVKSVLGENPDSPPAMQFEMLPGETVKDALALAGGLLPKAFADGLTLRRLDRRGVSSVVEIPMEKAGAFELRRGDVISALPRRDRVEAVVTVAGWARVPGAFPRKDGLRVGDLLKSPDQLMPDTYMERGEILRTFDDGSTKYLAFNVRKALDADPTHNLLLADRDRLELHRKDRMRPDESVTLSGPYSHAGSFPFHPGMRVADLLFKAGVPKKNANTMACELARSRYGKPSEVRKLDLGKLISTESESPVALEDETANPLLMPDDHILVYEKPEFRIHRTARISGQVNKPGTYVLDTERPTLKYLIERAGGLTPEAMLKAGIFYRIPKGAQEDATSVHTQDTSGITEILERLNEAKLMDGKISLPSAGANPNGGVSLVKVPVMHGLGTQKLNRVVVDFEGALKGDTQSDIELQQGDEVIIPRQTDTAMIIGETSTPFAFYRVRSGMDVGDMLKLAGGTTRNADTWNIRLLKADGRIFDSWVKGRKVEPGDAVLVPQMVRRDITWQENLTALIPVVPIIQNMLKK